MLCRVSGFRFARGCGSACGAVRTTRAEASLFSLFFSRVAPALFLMASRQTRNLARARETPHSALESFVPWYVCFSRRLGGLRRQAPRRTYHIGGGNKESQAVRGTRDTRTHRMQMHTTDTTYGTAVIHTAFCPPRQPAQHRKPCTPVQSLSHTTNLSTALRRPNAHERGARGAWR